MMLVCGVVQQIVSNVFRLIQKFVLWNAANPRKSAVDLMYAVIRMTFVVLVLAAAALMGQLVVGWIAAVLRLRLVVQGRMAISVAPHLNIVTLTVPAVRQNVQFHVMVSVVCPIPVVVVTDFAQMVLSVVMM
jgi:hypothetical protein